VSGIHEGTDIKGKVGSPVSSPVDGKLEVQKDGTMVVSVPNPDGSQYRVVVAHAEPKDQPGTSNKSVKQGEVIGTVQNPSKYVTEDSAAMTPHVHLGLKKRLKGGNSADDIPCDPNVYLERPLDDGRGRPAPPAYRRGR
jgi:murein DD-endopeptidase MepM/ murein hydrolase activator NlpD